MQNGAGESERDDQGTDTLKVASLFAELGCICADGSWEMPETKPEADTANADRAKPGPRSRFWRWL